MSNTPRTSNESVHDEAANSDQFRKPKTFVQEFLVNTSKMWGSAIESIDQLLEDLGLYVIIDNIGQQLASHPFLALGASAFIISVTLPFILFLLFAIATVVLTFFGFVIVEGTLITIASAFLFGFLAVVVGLFLLLGSIVSTGYLGFMQIYDLLYPKHLFINFHQPKRRRPHLHGHTHLRHDSTSIRSLNEHIM